MNAPARIPDASPADDLPRVVVMAGPFDVRREIVLGRPMTIAEAILTHGLADGELRFRLPTVAALSSNPADAPFELRSTWHTRMVTRGETLVLTSVPGRGGGSSGGGGKNVLGTIGMLALAIAAPWAAGLAFGAGTLAASIATVAILAAGGLLLNALMPTPTQETPKDARPVYTVNASNNQATPLEPLLELFGRLRYPPRFASRPYSKFAGNDQILYQLFYLTRGHAAIQRIDIGNTLLWSEADGLSPSFSDVRAGDHPPRRRGEPLPGRRRDGARSGGHPDERSLRRDAGTLRGDRGGRRGQPDRTRLHVAAGPVRPASARELDLSVGRHDPGRPPPDRRQRRSPERLGAARATGVPGQHQDAAAAVHRGRGAARALRGPGLRDVRAATRGRAARRGSTARSGRA